MSDVTVYQTVAEDGTLRMALHPMNEAPPQKDDQAPEDPGYNVGWPFRVVWISYEEGEDEWVYSCRGADARVCPEIGQYTAGEWAGRRPESAGAFHWPGLWRTPAGHRLPKLVQT